MTTVTALLTVQSEVADCVTGKSYATSDKYTLKNNI